jgi:phosphatidylserine/phosphatidylglycerophosphate/cardiolipin synthase-like enzyme
MATNLRTRRNTLDGIEDAKVALISDADYRRVVQHLARTSGERFLANIFIVDPTPGRDSNLKVDSLLVELQGAAERGVDVRLLIGGSSSNTQIAEATIMAHWRAKQLGIESKLIAFNPGASSHMKIVVSDDAVLSGSHNWSGGAFSGSQVQDSILILSADAAALFSSQFEKDWKAAKKDFQYV